MLSSLLISNGSLFDVINSIRYVYGMVKNKGESLKHGAQIYRESWCTLQTSFVFVTYKFSGVHYLKTSSKEQFTSPCEIMHVLEICQ